jgi:hypothetical protein
METFYGIKDLIKLIIEQISLRQLKLNFIKSQCVLLKLLYYKEKALQLGKMLGGKDIDF